MSESGKYPSVLDHTKWAEEFHELTGMWAAEAIIYHDFLAEKVCDWQRARDAEICGVIASQYASGIGLYDEVKEEVARICDESIRKPS